MIRDRLFGALMRTYTFPGTLLTLHRYRSVWLILEETHEDSGCCDPRPCIGYVYVVTSLHQSPLLDLEVLLNAGSLQRLCDADPALRAAGGVSE